MFERFTDRARRVVVLAQEEARLLDHDYIGTEHILLGLLHDDESLAGVALTRLGVVLGDVRTQVEEIIGRGDAPASGRVPFTPRAKKALELSLREALQLGHDYIGTEHILLGLIREGEGVAAQVLVKLGADLDRLRVSLLQVLAAQAGEEGEPREGPDFWGEGTSIHRRVASETRTLRPSSVPPEDMPACPTCHAALATSAVTRILDVALPEGGTTHQVAFVYCGQCGFALGVTRP